MRRPAGADFPGEKARPLSVDCERERDPRRTPPSAAAERDRTPGTGVQARGDYTGMIAERRLPRGVVGVAPGRSTTTTSFVPAWRDAMQVGTRALREQVITVAWTGTTACFNAQEVAPAVPATPAPMRVTGCDSRRDRGRVPGLPAASRGHGDGALERARQPARRRQPTTFLCVPCHATHAPPSGPSRQGQRGHRPCGRKHGRPVYGRPGRLRARPASA